MGQSMRERPSANERLTDARPCGRSAKADLEPHIRACDMRGPAREALKRTVKQEAAASDLGITQSRLSHKFADGSLTLKEMESFGPSYAAEFGRRLTATYGEQVKTPAERARERLPEIIREILELTA